jgi:hypothetical protein
MQGAETTDFRFSDEFWNYTFYDCRYNEASENYAQRGFEIIKHFWYGQELKLTKKENFFKTRKLFD